MEENLLQSDKQENNVEWLRGDKTVSCALAGHSRLNSKVRKYAEDYPAEVRITAENPDGSITAVLPLKWLKLSPPRKVSDKQREAARERLNAYREAKEWEGVE